jgi:nuclear pore complex protein Nup188
MAQETKYTLFLLCGLARLSGQWRMLLPDSLPAFRRATAALLDFVASPGAVPISCTPVSAAERAAARGAAAGGAAEAALAHGWFGAAAAGANAGAGAAQRGSAPAGGYAWQLADRLYSSAQYALSFQLALAPEVGEDELAELGPEWVRPATLLALQASTGHCKGAPAAAIAFWATACRCCGRPTSTHAACASWSLLLEAHPHASLPCAAAAAAAGGRA